MHWNNREGSVVAIDEDRSSNLTDDWLFFFLTYEMECYMLLHFVSNRSKIDMTSVCYFILSITYP